MKRRRPPRGEGGVGATVGARQGPRVRTLRQRPSEAVSSPRRYGGGSRRPREEARVPIVPGSRYVRAALGRDEPARVHPVNIVVQPGLVLPADRREHDRDRTVLSLARLGGRGPAQLPQATGQSRLRS
jgi:hypothetical protein